MTLASKTVVVLLVVMGTAAVLLATGRTVSLQDIDPTGVEIANLGTITPIDVPGATSTLASDINAAGFVVGRYASAGRTHGFLRSPEGEFSTIDFPGASLTVAAAINDRGDIAGQYALPTAPTQRHGFLLKEGEFTSFDPPGSVFTNALGIDERGDIVGRYCVLALCAVPGSGSFHGFLMHDGEFTTIDVPDAIETDSFKVNGRGQIVGGFLTYGQREQIFLSSNGELTTFAPPDGQPVSLDNGGVNERGDIVGVYCDSALPCLIVPTGTHGFLFTDGKFRTVDVPGSLATAALGINARREIVGQYADATGSHGFLLSRWVYQSSAEHRIRY